MCQSLILFRNPCYSLLEVLCCETPIPHYRAQIMTNDDNVHEPDTARLLSTSYHSPYTRSGAPALPASQDPYAKLRARALQTLEAMGFDPDTMVEHGVLFAEHQDPFGHVSNAQFLAFFGQTWMRVTDAYGQYLSKEELDGIYQAKTVVPMVRRFELEIKRQVKFPDSVSNPCCLDSLVSFAFISST